MGEMWWIRAEAECRMLSNKTMNRVEPWANMGVEAKVEESINAKKIPLEGQRGYFENVTSL